jgi:hypothetical protein
MKVNCPYCLRENTLKDPTGYRECFKCKKVFGFHIEIKEEVKAWRLSKQQVGLLDEK